MLRIRRPLIYLCLDIHTTKIQLVSLQSKHPEIWCILYILLHIILTQKIVKNCSPSTPACSRDKTVLNTTPAITRSLTHEYTDTFIATNAYDNAVLHACMFEAPSSRLHRHEHDRRRARKRGG